MFAVFIKLKRSVVSLGPEADPALNHSPIKEALEKTDESLL